jgi:predicted amino acid racemase
VSSPRIEVDLDRIGRNAHELVRRTAARGVSVTAITKAMHGHPGLGRALLAAGAVALGDSRIENIERLRAGGIDAPILLIRSPLPSETARVVAAADSSCNTEVEIVELLSAEATRARRVHGVMLMVELGDLREGIMPGDVPDAIADCLALPNIEVRGIGANLACRNGVAPDDHNMGELSSLAISIEAKFGITLSTVSAGNSANLEWLRSTEHVGRIDDLRLGESILLGRDPLHDVPVPGLHQDAATIVAEVIESKYKPRRAWGERARTPFTPPAVTAPDDERCGWQSLLGIGHQDTDPLDLTAPPGMRIIGASSDHLVLTSAHRLRLGSEVAFRPGYSALVRAMSSRYLQPIVHGGPGR